MLYLDNHPPVRLLIRDDQVTDGRCAPAPASSQLALVYFHLIFNVLPVTYYPTMRTVGHDNTAAVVLPRSDSLCSSLSTRRLSTTGFLIPDLLFYVLPAVGREGRMTRTGGEFISGTGTASLFLYRGWVPDEGVGDSVKRQSMDSAHTFCSRG